MIKIGVELNGIVRDINTQIVKYYTKDINKGFDDETVNKNVVNVAYDLDFGSKKKREEFLYVDYPYEVFGCARVCSKNLATKINNWLVEFENIEDEDYELVFFSTNENALTIQSSYYFLSKIGCRVREMYFPKDSSKMWDICDVIITTNKNVINSKPNGKRSVLIEKDDNKELVDSSDFVYENLASIIESETFLNDIKTISTKNVGLKNKILKFFNR